MFMNCTLKVRGLRFGQYLELEIENVLNG